ncbi:MAG: hypothetical protein JO076_04135, partial [Verrucomicrobia bacterium]|nr:hypothetical protein [Verrucomicrobiota bacterium]
MPLPTDCDFIKDFQLGDLIYGTTFDRKDYISAATDKLQYAEAKVTIDRLTKELDVALRGWGEYATEKLSEEQFMELPQ